MSLPGKKITTFVPSKIAYVEATYQGRNRDKVHYPQQVVPISLYAKITILSNLRNEQTEVCEIGS
jgi:hypothetical protein